MKKHIIDTLVCLMRYVLRRLCNQETLRSQVVQSHRRDASACRNAVYLRMVEWIKAHMTTRRNIMRDETEWSWMGCEEYRPFNKATYNTIWHRMMQDGVGAWMGDMKSYFGQLDHTPIDPAKQYVMTLPAWDGTDHVTALIHRFTHNEVCVDAMRLWLRGMTAMMMHHGYDTWANNLMPILIGAQGVGKTRLCRMLLPWGGDYYCEDFALGGDQDYRRRMACNVLICIDELDRLTTRQTALLKNILSQEQIDAREGYTHARIVRRRAASFIATTNECDVLTDQSGSRRFVCIQLPQTIDYTTPIDHDALYAQLRDEVLAGLPYYPDHELEKRIEQHNSSFYSPNQVAEVMAQHYEFVPYGSCDASRVYCSELFERLRSQHIALMREYTVRSFGRALSTLVATTCQARGMDINAVRGRDRKGHWYSVRQVA